jgi:hypothetical protein
MFGDVQKWQNQQTSHGLSGEDKPFSFPWYEACATTFCGNTRLE